MSELSPVIVAQDPFEDEYHQLPQSERQCNFVCFLGKNFCDVTFTFPNLPDKIKAHQKVLKARSPVFAQKFRELESENAPRRKIKIREFTPKAFQKFLEFIYIDEFEEDVDIVEALDLWRLSQKYQVHQLTRKCEELLKSDIPTLDSVQVYETALRYDHPELTNRAAQVMVKSFPGLLRVGALANAEEWTLVYLLERDELAVKEVELFQFILNWGRERVGPSADEEQLRKQLVKLIPRVRYTSMNPDEFTNMVVPTGFLTAEEILSVYSYFCGDKDARRDLKIEFNTTFRKAESRERKAEYVDFFPDLSPIPLEQFPAFSKHCLSFKVDQMQVDGKVAGGVTGQENHLKKSAIMAIHVVYPTYLSSVYHNKKVPTFHVSIGEQSGHDKEGNFTVRFEMKLEKRSGGTIIPVDPPVELILGRTYSVILECISTSNSSNCFQDDPEPCRGLLIPSTTRKAPIDLARVSMTLKEIRTKTDYFQQKFPDGSKELFTIPGVHIGLM